MCREAAGLTATATSTRRTETAAPSRRTTRREAATARSEAARTATTTRRTATAGRPASPEAAAIAATRATTPTPALLDWAGQSGYGESGSLLTLRAGRRFGFGKEPFERKQAIAADEKLVALGE